MGNRAAKKFLDKFMLLQVNNSRMENVILIDQIMGVIVLKRLQIQKIEQISIRVKDIEKAIEFYRDKLEMDLNFTANNMAFFNCGDNTIMLAVPEKEQFDHPSSVLYFEVKDIEESFQLLRERGVKMQGKPHIVHRTDTSEKWMLFFEDVDNNVLALTSNVTVE